MQFLKLCVLFSIMALVIGCTSSQSDFNEIEGPMVQSLDPNITIEKWTYLSPEQLSQTNNPLVSSNNDGIAVGDEQHKTSIIWTKQGFDLYWSELPCATKPILLIKENSIIELFGGKQPPPPTECQAMEASHAFVVILSSTIPIPPASEWTYQFHPSEQQ